MSIKASDIFTAPSGASGYSGVSGWSGNSGQSAWSGVSGVGTSGWSGTSGTSGGSGVSGYGPLTSVSAYSAYHLMAAGERTALVDASTAAVTVSLPTAASITGKAYVVKKTDATLNVAMISGFSGTGQTIDGNAVQSLLYQNQSLTVVSDGTNWRVE